MDTKLDSEYNNGILDVNVQVSGSQEGAFTVEAALYDRKDVSVPAIWSALVRGHGRKGGGETKLNVSIPVASPKKWSAETPYLYTLVVSLNVDGAVSQAESCKVGFR